MIERVLAFSVRRRWFVRAGDAACGGCGPVVVDPAPDRRGSGHHQQSGADQFRRARAFAGRCREAGDVPGRDGARRDSRPRIHALDLPQRLFPGDGGLQGSHRHLFRAPAGRRAPDRGAALAAARRRPADGADFNRSRRNLHVDGRLFSTGRESRRAGTVSRVRNRDGSYLTPEGQRLRGDFERAAYLRTVQDWIIRPQLRNVPGVAGVDAIGGYVKQYHVQPRPERADRRSAYPSATSPRRWRGTTPIAAPVTSSRTAKVTWSARAGGSRAWRRSETSSSRRATAYRSACATSPTSRSGGELRTGSASQNGQEVVVGTALMLIGANSRTVSAAVDAKMQEIRRTLPPGVEVKTVLEPHPSGRRHHQYRCQEPRRGRAPRHPRAVPAAGKLPRRAHHRAGDSDLHAADRDGNAAGPDQRQSDEPGRARFRPDRRWRRHHRGEQPAPSGGAPAPAGSRRWGSTSAWRRSRRPPRR